MGIFTQKLSSAADAIKKKASEVADNYQASSSGSTSTPQATGQIGAGSSSYAAQPVDSSSSASKVSKAAEGKEALRKAVAKIKTASTDSVSSTTKSADQNTSAKSSFSNVLSSLSKNSEASNGFFSSLADTIKNKSTSPDYVGSSGRTYQEQSDAFANAFQEYYYPTDDTPEETRLARMQDEQEKLIKMQEEKKLYEKALSYRDKSDEDIAAEYERLTGLRNYEDKDIATYDELIKSLTQQKEDLNPEFITSTQEYDAQQARMSEIEKELNHYIEQKALTESSQKRVQDDAAADMGALQLYLSGSGYLEKKYGTGDRNKIYQELQTQYDATQNAKERSILTMDMALLKDGAEYDRYLNYDMKQAEKTIEEIKQRQEELEAEALELAERLIGDTGDMSEAQVRARRDQIKSEEAVLQKQIETIRNDMVGAKSVQTLDPFYRTVMADDFAKYSAEGAAIKNDEYDSLWDDFTGGVSTWFAQMKNPAKAARETANLQNVDTSYRFMTDEEYNIYNYLLAKEGKAKAEEFHLALLDVLNSREGGKIAENIESLNPALRALATAGLGAVGGLERFGAGTRNAFRALMGEEANPTPSLQYASALVREGLSGVGGQIGKDKSLAQMGFDAVQTIGNMAPSIGLGFMGGAIAAGLPSWAGAAVSRIGTAAMGVSAGGNYYSEALQKGYNKDEARIYGTLAGAAEATLQDILGGITSLGGRIPTSISQNVLSNIDNAWLRMGGELLVRDFGEGVEEYLQDVLTPVFYNIAAGEHNTVELFNNPEAAYSFLLACVTTSLLEGGDVYNNTVAASKLGSTYHTLFNSQSDLIQRAAEWEGDDGKLAQRILNGETKLTDTNLGQIIRGFIQRGEADTVNEEIIKSVVDKTPEAFQQVYQALQNPNTFVMDNDAKYILDNTPGKDAEWVAEQQALLTALLNGRELTPGGWKLLDVTNPALQEVFASKTGAEFAEDMDAEDATNVFRSVATAIREQKGKANTAAAQAQENARTATDELKQQWLASQKKTSRADQKVAAIMQKKAEQILAEQRNVSTEGARQAVAQTNPQVAEAKAAIVQDAKQPQARTRAEQKVDALMQLRGEAALAGTPQTTESTVTSATETEAPEDTAAKATIPQTATKKSRAEQKVDALMQQRAAAILGNKATEATTPQVTEAEAKATIAQGTKQQQTTKTRAEQKVDALMKQRAAAAQKATAKAETGNTGTAKAETAKTSNEALVEKAKKEVPVPRMTRGDVKVAAIMQQKGKQILAAKSGGAPSWYNQSMGDLTDKVTYKNGTSITRQQWIERGMKRFGQTAEESNKTFSKKLAGQKSETTKTTGSTKTAKAPSKTDTAKGTLTEKKKSDKLPKKFDKTVSAFNTDVSYPSDASLNELHDYLVKNGADKESHPYHELYQQVAEEVELRKGEWTDALELADKFRLDPGSLTDAEICSLYDFIAKHTDESTFNDIFDRVEDELINNRGFNKYVERVKREVQKKLSALGRAEPVRGRDGGRNRVGTGGEVGSAAGKSGGNGGVQEAGGASEDTGGSGRVPAVSRDNRAVKLEPGEEVSRGTYIPKGMKRADDATVRNAVGPKVYDAIKRTGLDIIGADILCDKNGNIIPGVTVLGKNGKPEIYVSLKHGEHTKGKSKFSAPGIALHEATHQWMASAFGAQHTAKAREFAERILNDAGVSEKDTKALFARYAQQYQKAYESIAKTDPEAFRNRVWEEIFCDMIGGAPYAFVADIGLNGKFIGVTARNLLEDQRVIEEAMSGAGTEGSTRNYYARERLTSQAYYRDDIYGWADDMVDTAYKTDDNQISLDEWINAGREEDRNVHPDVQARIDTANNLEERVQQFFRNVPKDNKSALTPEEIEDYMTVDPYKARGDIADAAEVVNRLSDIAKDQPWNDRRKTWLLMEDLLPHLDTGDRNLWTESRFARDKAFTQWYENRHPSLYYPGYTIEKDLTREAAYLVDYIRKSQFEEDRAAAQSLLNSIRRKLAGDNSFTVYKTDDRDEPMAMFSTVTEIALADPKSKIQNAFNKNGEAKADNLKSQLQKLVKPQEMQWAGLNYFFDQHKGETVTKQQLIDFLEGNEIQIEQTGYHAPDGTINGYVNSVTGVATDSIEAAIDDILYDIQMYDGTYGVDRDTYEPEDVQQVFDVNDTDNVKLVLTTHDGETVELCELHPQYDSGTARWGGPEPQGGYGNYALNGGEDYREYTYKYSNRKAEFPYTNQSMSLHFEDSDLLGHARIQDFYTPDGKKVLFIEEIQSDWASALRKGGKFEDNPEYEKIWLDTQRLYDKAEKLRNASRAATDKKTASAYKKAHEKTVSEAKTSQLEELKYVLAKKGCHLEYVENIEDESEEGDKAITNGWSVADDAGNFVQWPADAGFYRGQMVAPDEATAAEIAINLLKIGAPAPDMPFGKDYYKFILKDLLYKASLGEYDYIAWATPEMQSERYYDGSDAEAKQYQEYRYDFRSPAERSAASTKEERNSKAGPIQSFLSAYTNSNKWTGDMGLITLDGAKQDPGHKMTITPVPSMLLDPKMKETILYMDQPLYKADDSDIAYGTEENYAPVFYDKLERVVEQQFPAKLGASQVANWLKGKGVKEEDIKWSGLRTFLEGKKNVTKDELLDFLRDQDLNIETTILTGNQIRWGRYTTEGGTNNREILFELPNEYWNQSMLTHWGRSGVLAHARVQDREMINPETGEVYRTLFVDEIQSDWHNAGMREGYQTEEDIEKKYNELLTDYEREKAAYDKRVAKGDVRTVKDIVDETVDTSLGDAIVEAARRLSPSLNWSERGFIEDLAESYVQYLDDVNNGFEYPEDTPDEPATPTAMTYYRGINKELPQDMREAYSAFLDEIEDSYNKGFAYYNKPVEPTRRDAELALPGAPDAPFSKTYHEYVMKRLLRMAAEGGYEAIGWTSAKQQEDRWSDRFAEGYRIEYDQDIPKFMRKYGKQWGAQVYRDTNSGIDLVDKELGREMAWAIDTRFRYERMIERMIAEGRTENVANAQEIIDRANARIEEIEAEAGKIVPWLMDIPKAMSDSVLYEGQPLFKAEDEAAAEAAGVNLDEAFPEGSFERILLDMMRTGNTSLAEAYIQGIVERSKNPTYTETPNPAFTPVTDEEINTIREAESKLIKRYGELKPGEKPARDIKVAEKRSEDKRTRRHAPHVAEAAEVPEHTARALERFIATDEAASYSRISDKSAIEKADFDIKTRGIEKMMKEWDGISSPSHNPTKNDIALGETLALWAAHNGRDDIACKIWADVNVMATQAGQVVQAMKLIKRMAPEYQVYYVQKVVDKLNHDYAKKILRGWKGMQEIRIDEDLKDAVLHADTQEDLDAAMDELISDIAGQIPASFKEKWDSWRYFAMLGNPRTHVRNIIGNAVFAPLVFGKNLMAAGIEKMLPENQRTKAFIGRGKYKAFANNDFQEMRGTITGEGNKYVSPRNSIMAKRKIWKTNAMNKVTEAVGDALNAEDAWFLKPYYTNALAGYLASRNADIDALQSTPEGRKLLNDARMYAVNEAQKATYRDASTVAQALNKLKRTPGLGLLLDGVMPFVGTPVNILRRGIEYSPVGLMKTLTYNAAQLARGTINANQFIDNLSSGMTGTMVAALGFWLARAGILRGGDEDEDRYENFVKNLGYQNFSLNFDINGKKHNYTIDWAAPSALPLFTGAAAYKLFARDEELSAGDMFDAMTLLADPMMQLSMLDGLNRTLSSLSYANKNEMIATLAQEMGTSYFGQAIPTLFGQIARTMDGTRRSSYTDKNSDVPKWIQYFIQSSVQNKIPVWEEEKMAYIDQWGRRDTEESIALRAIENFLSPGYINQINVTPVDQELERLYQTTGEKEILPTKGSKYFSVDGERKDLTAKEFERFCEESGQVKFALLSDLFTDKRYTDAPDSVKLALIEDMYKYANASTKYHIDGNYNIHNQGKWIEDAEASGNVYESIMDSRYSQHMKNAGREVAAEAPVTENPVAENSVADSIHQKLQSKPTLPALSGNQQTTPTTTTLTADQKKMYESGPKAAGVTESAYASAMTQSDTDGNGNIKQDELGTYLNHQVRAGTLTQEQANAIWNSTGKWKTSYDTWYGKKDNAYRSNPLLNDDGQSYLEEVSQLLGKLDDMMRASMPVRPQDIEEDYTSRGWEVPQEGQAYSLLPYTTKDQYDRWHKTLEKWGANPTDIWGDGQGTTVDMVDFDLTPEEYDEILTGYMDKGVTKSFTPSTASATSGRTYSGTSTKAKRGAAVTRKKK